MSFTCTTAWFLKGANAVWARRFDRVRAGVIASTALALALGGCQGKPSSTPSGAEIRLPDQEARDFTLTESSVGKKSWTLRATYAAMYNDRHLVDAKTVLIEFFDAKGETYSTLVAEEGLVHQRTNDLEARGKVKIVTTTGVTLETDSLRWINATGKIVSDAFVRVTRHGDIVTGRGFESDPNLDHFQLVSDVHAEVREPEEGIDGSETP